MIYLGDRLSVVMAWLADLEWGDVATWVQGIATAGTLWLGFTILRSDRKRAERAQAAQITVWHDTDKEGRPWTEYDFSEPHWALNVWNTSTQPVTRPFIWLVAYTHKEFARTEHGYMDYDRVIHESTFRLDVSIEDAPLSLDPGQRVCMPVSVPEVAIKKALLHFTDAAGTQWTRDILTSRLKRHREVKLPEWAFFILLVLSRPIRKCLRLLGRSSTE